MSSLIINFPDCARLGSHDPGRDVREGQDTITVWTDGCPAPVTVEGPPPLVPWWGFLLGTLLAGGAIIAIGIVRYRAHERKQADRAAELDAQVALAEAHKNCTYCGNKYEPTLKEK